jgi:hypothetical protein
MIELRRTFTLAECAVPPREPSMRCADAHTPGGRATLTA